MGSKKTPQKLDPISGVLSLDNVHDALVRAQTASMNNVASRNANFKMNPIKKELAMEICKSMGTDLSEFLRQCVDGLIADYVGPKKFQELSAKAASSLD